MTTLKPLTVKEWQSIFAELYLETDKNRRPEQIWIAIMAHASQMGESIRTFKFFELIKSAAHTFCWLCSFINRCNTEDDPVFALDESLSGIVSLKYPLICGHCKGNECKCDPISMDKAKDKAARYTELFEKRKGILTSVEDYTIEQWRKTFRDIFGGRMHILTLETIGFHFLEEAGEAAVGVRKLSQLRKILDAGVDGIDNDFLRKLSKVSSAVEYYKIHKGTGQNYISKDPGDLKSRLVEAKMDLIVEIGDTFSWFCSVV